MEGAPKNAIDLLGKMLVLDPRKRITPKEVKIDFYAIFSFTKGFKTSIF